MSALLVKEIVHVDLAVDVSRRGAIELQCETPGFRLGGGLSTLEEADARDLDLGRLRRRDVLERQVEPLQVLDVVQRQHAVRLREEDVERALSQADSRLLRGQQID